MLKLDDVLKYLNESKVIRPEIVDLVGGLPARGETTNDIDFLIKFHSIRPSAFDELVELVNASTSSEPEKQMMRTRIRRLQQEIYDEIVFPIEHNLRRSFPPELQNRISIFLDEYNGPFTSAIPVWSLRCEKIKEVDEMSEEIIHQEDTKNVDLMDPADLENEIKSIEGEKDLAKAVARALEDLRKIMEILKTREGPTLYPYPKYPYPQDVSQIEWDSTENAEDAKQRIIEGIKSLIDEYTQMVQKVHQEYAEREKSEIIAHISGITGEPMSVYEQMDISALRVMKDTLEKVRVHERTEFKVQSEKNDVDEIVKKFESRRRRSL